MLYFYIKMSEIDKTFVSLTCTDIIKMCPVTFRCWLSGTLSCIELLVIKTSDNPSERGSVGRVSMCPHGAVLSPSHTSATRGETRSEQATGIIHRWDYYKPTNKLFIKYEIVGHKTAQLMYKTQHGCLPDCVQRLADIQFVGKNKK